MQTVASNAGSASWYYLSFAVKDQSGFSPDDPATNAPGLIGLIQAQDSTAEGTVFGYAADDSQLIPADYVDTIRVDYTRAQLNPAGSGDWDLTALDWGMGVIARTPNGQNSSLFAERELFYFTLTDDWVSTAAVTTITEPGTSNFIGLDCRTIYVMRWIWDPSTAGYRWTFPEVAWSETDLFGGFEPDAEIDALSVYRGANTYDNPERVVFSLVQDSTASYANAELSNPFLVAQHARAGYTVDVDVDAVSLKTDGGVPFSVKTQIDPTTGPDPHGFCGLDPDDLAEPDNYVAWPTLAPELSAGLAEVGFAMWREESELDETGTTLHLEVNGGKEQGIVIGAVEFQIAMAPINGSLPKPKSFSVPFMTGLDATHSSLTIGSSGLVPGVRYRIQGRAVLHGFALVGGNLVPVAPVDSWASELIHVAE